MPDGLREIFKQLAAFWAGLSNGKRTALVVMTFAVAGVVGLIPYLSSRPHMVPLYANMEPEDAAQVVAKLESQQVPYELRAGGATILVPEERLYKLRLDMAAEGLPKGSSVGFELFDKSQFGATEFEQHVNLKRALEGELARSIATVEGVHAARVHLVLPRPTVFVAKKEEASASVVVKLKNLDLFGKREVAAVVHLVAAAVPGLSHNHVSVVSTEGLTLHRPTSSELGVGTEGLVEESQSVSSQLEAKALAQLERVVGPGGADVRIAATLDSSTHEETKETFAPEKTALRSEHTSSEEIRNQTPGAEGIPGARSNMPDNNGTQATQATAAQNVDTTSRNSSTRNWEVDRTVAKVHTPPGKVARLSVAVLLDGAWKKGSDGKEVFQPRSEQEVKDLTEVVKQAVGFDALRGDTIAVTAARFARPELEVTEPLKALPWYRAPFVLLAAGALLLLILGLSIYLVRSRKKREAAKAIEVATARERELLETSSLRTGEGADSSNPALGNFDPKLLTGTGPEAISAIRQMALDMAAKDPSSTAVVLRAWLAEGETQEKSGKAA
jgi:flagellar M-ring protein FliF